MDILLTVCCRFQHEICDILITKTIELCWILSHAGILGIEEADMSTKCISVQATQVIRLQYTDWYPLVKAKFHEKFTNGWRLRPSKLRYVLNATGIWDEIHVMRRRAVIMRRLRCGHTKLTHGYLTNNNVLEAPPGCTAC